MPELTFTCPNCHKQYIPVLNRKHFDIPIQEEFPNAPSWQREQWLTGICSPKCWNEFLGPEERKHKKSKPKIKKCKCKKR